MKFLFVRLHLRVTALDEFLPLAELGCQETRFLGVTFLEISVGNPLLFSLLFLLLELFLQALFRSNFRGGHLAESQ